MVEQWTHKPLVGGSNPPLATFYLKDSEWKNPSLAML